MKRLLLLCVFFAFLLSFALADVYQGSIVSVNEVPVYSPSSGTLLSLDMTVGQRTDAGQALGTLSENKVFASRNGTIAHVNTPSGFVDGNVLELAPGDPYILYCTSLNSYQEPQAQYIHIGETVYIRCTKDSTHQAIGIITQIDNYDFKVIPFGGELFIGETVYCYRTTDFEAENRVGKGTVVSPDTEKYTANGYIASMRVTDGTSVQTGQLLYTWTDGEGSTLVSPANGTITSVSVSQGMSIQKDQQCAMVAPDDSLRVSISVPSDRISTLHVGQKVFVRYADDKYLTDYSGTVTQILDTEENGARTVYVTPDEVKPIIGLGAEIQFDD